MVVGLIKGGLKMSLHILNNYHFTKENILSLFNYINKSENISSLGDYICIYDIRNNIVCEYKYFQDINEPYPKVYTLEEDTIFKYKTIFKEGFCDVSSLAEDLVSNNVYKIEQKCTKESCTKDSNDNLINVINMWIE